MFKTSFYFLNSQHTNKNAYFMYYLTDKQKAFNFYTRSVSAELGKNESQLMP